MKFRLKMNKSETTPKGFDGFDWYIQDKKFNDFGIDFNNTSKVKEAKIFDTEAEAIAHMVKHFEAGSYTVEKI